MTTAIDNYLKEDIVSFAFKKIETYTNYKGEIKKRPVGMPQLLVLSLIKYLT